MGTSMTHENLRDKIDKLDCAGMVSDPVVSALREIVELHCGTINNRCMTCLHGGKCEIIQIIEKSLK
jgi:hypothetical protein